MTAALVRAPASSPSARGFAAANPVTKLGASALLTLALVPSLDWVSASVALALEGVLLAFAGVPWRTLLVRTLPLWIAAPLAGLTVLLYGRPEGRVYVSWLLVQISDGSVELAIATVLRVLAIGLPAVALFLTVDPTDLADGLAQLLKLPSRFVLGALGGLRLMGLFREDWRALEQARRARGIADAGRLRRFAGQAFALLVLAIRRGSTLATAMEARAFGAPVRRTWARTARLGTVDWVLLAASAVIGTVAVAASVWAGEWSLLGRG
jgi:energy-coupling factor transport system permease protein